jgi:ABC-type nitrate/sulfonate/bicarbonate transport system substrate-binding protein
MKRLVFGVLLSSVGALVGAIVAGAAPEVSEVTLGVSQSPQLAAQVVVALEQGYFKKEGITPKIRWTPSGREFAEAFAARAVVMGTSGEQPAINLAHRGLPVRVFAQLCEMSGSLGVVVKPAVQKPEDLYGKKVAFFPGTTSELLFQGFVHRYKLDAAKMQQFHMDPPESVAAFVRGDVDAIFAWEPNVARAAKGGGKVLASGSRSYVPGQEGPHRMAPGHGAFSVSTEFAQKHPQAVRAVLRALVAGNAYLQTADSIPTVAKWMNKHTNMAVEMIEVTMRSTRYVMALDPQLLEDMGVTQQFMLDKKQISRKVSPKDLYVLEPLRDVDPALVTMKVD